VHRRIDPSDQLLALATEQGGVVGAEQLVALDFSLRSAERLVHQRSWVRLATGVYQVGGLGDPSWAGLAWAGLLLGGHRARLGFEAAGHLWKIVDEPPVDITVLVPHGRPIADRGRWVFRQERSANRSPRSPGSPPRTTIEDTVVDLCSRADARALPGLLTKAVQGRRTTAQRILARVDDRARVRHRELLREMLTDVAQGAESPLELRYLTEIERPHGLPRAKRQVRSRNGKEIRDLLYEEWATIVELDGRVHIAGRFRDMERDNAALLGGDVTLRYGWPDVTERPCAVAWEVAALLIRRGWTGVPTRCRLCALATDADLGSV
jgi:very-short-patch-repair endonuclease